MINPQDTMAHVTPILICTSHVESTSISTSNEHQVLFTGNPLTSRWQEWSCLIHCSHLIFFIQQGGEMFPG